MMVNISFTLYLKVISSLAFTAIYRNHMFTRSAPSVDKKKKKKAVNGRNANNDITLRYKVKLTFTIIIQMFQYLMMNLKLNLI